MKKTFVCGHLALVVSVELIRGFAGLGFWSGVGWRRDRGMLCHISMVVGPVDIYLAGEWS